MATSEVAALLDELMGKNRNALPTESGNRGAHWSDDDVCKYYICGFCPSELFTNTKADLGICPNEHDERMQEMYLKSDRCGKMGYEKDFVRYLNTLLIDVERRIRRGHARLNLNSTMSNPNGLGNVERKIKLTELTDKINELVAESEKLGTEGCVDKAQAVLKQCEQLKLERSQLEEDVEDRSTGLAKELEVCEICGAFRIRDDAPQRIEEHLIGKMHLGYARIRDYIREFEEKENKRRDDRLKQHEREKKAELPRNKGREDRSRRSRSKSRNDRIRNRNGRSRSKELSSHSRRDTSRGKVDRDLSQARDQNDKDKRHTTRSRSRDRKRHSSREHDSDRRNRRGDNDKGRRSHHNDDVDKNRRSRRSEERDKDNRNRRGDERDKDRNSRRDEQRDTDKKSSRGEERDTNKKSSRGEERDTDKKSSRGDERDTGKKSSRGEERDKDRKSRRSEERDTVKKSSRVEERDKDRKSRRSEERSKDRKNSRSEENGKHRISNEDEKDKKSRPSEDNKEQDRRKSEDRDNEKQNICSLDHETSSRNDANSNKQNETGGSSPSKDKKLVEHSLTETAKQNSPNTISIEKCD